MMRSLSFKEVHDLQLRIKKMQAMSIDGDFFSELEEMQDVLRRALDEAFSPPVRDWYAKLELQKDYARNPKDYFFFRYYDYCTYIDVVDTEYVVCLGKYSVRSLKHFDTFEGALDCFRDYIIVILSETSQNELCFPPDDTEQAF